MQEQKGNMSRIMKQIARDNWIPNDKVDLLQSLPPGVLCEKKKLLFLFETFSCIFCYLQPKIFLYTLFPLLYFPHVILKSCQFYCLLNSVLLFIFILMFQFKLLLLFVLIFYRASRYPCRYSHTPPNPNSDHQCFLIIFSRKPKTLMMTH